jgi:hypothetical protein
VQSNAQGHPGLLRVTLQYLLWHFHVDLKTVPTSTEAVTYYVGSDLLAQAHLKRFLVPIQPTELRGVFLVLKKVLRGDTVTIPPDLADNDDAEEAAKRLLVRHLVLIEDERSKRLLFASPLHERFYCKLLFPSCVSTEMKYSSIDDLILAVLRTFEPEQLEDRRNWGSSFTKEGPLQHMFFRGALKCLPPSVQVSAEVLNYVQAGRIQAKSKGKFCSAVNDYWKPELMIRLCIVIR